MKNPYLFVSVLLAVSFAGHAALSLVSSQFTFGPEYYLRSVLSAVLALGFDIAYTRIQIVIKRRRSS